MRSKRQECLARGRGRPLTANQLFQVLKSYPVAATTHFCETKPFRPRLVATPNRIGSRSRYKTNSAVIRTDQALHFNQGPIIV